MKRVRKTLFKDPRTTIITVIAFFLMGLFIYGVGPTITGSTVWDFYEISLGENECKTVLENEICLTKIFNPTGQAKTENMHALVTVGRAKAKSTVRGAATRIKLGDKEITNNLEISFTSLDEYQRIATLKIKNHYPAKIQNTGIETLWHPFVINSRLNSVIVYGDEQDKSKAYQIKGALKTKLNKYDIVPTYSAHEFNPEEHENKNIILIGTVSSNPLIKPYLSYDTTTASLGFLKPGEGYIHLIYDATKEYEFRRLDRQAILIITGRDAAGIQKSTNLLSNKDYYDLRSTRLVVKGPCTTISNCQFIAPELVV